jgi:putative intracellular protease/amidase
MVPKRWSCELNTRHLYTRHLTHPIDSVITVDVLVRAGVQVTSVFVGTGPSTVSGSDVNITATCSRGVKIQADKLFEASHFGPDKFDLVVVPGGAKGAETISRSSDVQALIGEFHRHGKLIGMICAGEMPFDKMNADYVQNADHVVSSEMQAPWPHRLQDCRSSH